MSGQYVKMESLSEEVFRRKAAGDTNREIAESCELTNNQIKQLVSRQNRFQPSISSPRCHYDNAAMENFFKTLKTNVCIE